MRPFHEIPFQNHPRLNGLFFGLLLCVPVGIYLFITMLAPVAPNKVCDCHQICNSHFHCELRECH